MYPKFWDDFSGWWVSYKRQSFFLRLQNKSHVWHEHDIHTRICRMSEVEVSAFESHKLMSYSMNIFIFIRMKVCGYGSEWAMKCSQRRSYKEAARECVCVSVCISKPDAEATYVFVRWHTVNVPQRTRFRSAKFYIHGNIMNRAPIHRENKYMQ